MPSAFQPGAPVMRPPGPASRVAHVIIVSDFADINGGQAKVAIDSAVLLADAGLQVTFFAACGPISPVLTHANIEVVCLNQHAILDDPHPATAAIRGIWNAEALKALRAVMADSDPARSVMHVHGYAKALSPSIGAAITEGRIATTFTMHEYFLACPNGGFYDYQKQEICTRKPLGLSCLCTNCDVRKASHKAWRSVRGIVASGLGAIPRRMRHAIYMTDLQRRVIAPYLPGAIRLDKVRNPVAAGGPPVDVSGNDALVFVGRLSPEKGAPLLARTAREMGLKVVFVGEGPKADDIRAATPDAEITGWLDPDGVQRQLARARALVFPSLWYEVQPLVPIEALLRGIPVVCGAWSAATDVVRDGANGAVFEHPTQASLADALRRVMAVPAFSSDELAAQVSPRAHCDRLLEVYDTLLVGP